MRRKKEITANQSHVYQINGSVLNYNMHSILFLLEVLLLHKKNYGDLYMLYMFRDTNRNETNKVAS